jgi:hypothetical protein
MKGINQKHGVHVGDLVKYMSRTVLVIGIDEEWVHGIELGESEIGKYKRHVLKVLK